VLERTQNDQGHPFNEQAALEELERLQAAIEQARRQRGQTVDEFDAFVRSFRNPPPADPVPVRPPAVRETIAPEPVAPPPVDNEASPVALPPSPVAPEEPSPVAARPSPFAEEPSPVAPRRSIFDDEDDAPADPRPSPLDMASSSSVRPQGKRVGFATLIGGLAAVAVVVIGAVMLLNRGGQEAAPQTTQSAAPAAATPAAPAPTEPARPAVPVGGLQAEIVTVRPVWVRVLVDGEKTIERELKGNDRIPLRAQRVIFVRAGDAGALRIVVNGQDQGVLGRDGEIVTRSFTSANR